MNEFYLQCRGTVGNSVLWWAINDAGYTCDIRCAKVWTKEQKENKVLRSFEKFWPKDQVDEVIQYHIDIQDLTHASSKFPHTLRQWRRDLCDESSPVSNR